VALLFIDPLELWLMLLGVTSLLLSAWAFQVLFRGKVDEDFNKGLAIPLFSIGVYALVSGLWGTFVWPLPSSYNIVLVHPWALFGVGLLSLSFSMYKGASLRGALSAIAPLGLIVIVYGTVILKNGMTREPLMAFLMYFSLGLSALLGGLAGVAPKYSRPLGAVVALLLAVGGLLALVTGVGAAFSHVSAWKPWSPWYGSVVVG